MILYIYIFVLILITLNLKLSEFFTYKLCNNKKLTGIHKNIVEKNKITRTFNNNWDIYIPCGYKFVEREITSLKLNNTNNKYIFGISGSDNIASKNNLWDILRNYYGISIASDIMPTTYVLSNPADMLLFNKTYSKNNIYILKKNLQRKLGLDICKNDRNKINNAKKNGFKLIQEYISDPFLVNGYKLNIRLYLFIKCNKNKKMFYMHKCGKCLYTPEKYKNNLDFNTNITSYKPNTNIYKINPLSLTQLYVYLDKHGHKSIVIKNKIRSVMSRMCYAMQNSVCTKSCLKNVTTFQLFGVDVRLDNKLNPKILEINKGPNMNSVNDTDNKLKSNIYSDIYNSINMTDTKITNYERLV